LVVYVWLTRVGWKVEGTGWRSEHASDSALPSEIATDEIKPSP